MPYTQKAASRNQTAKDTLKKAKEIVDADLGDWPSTIEFRHQRTKTLDTIVPHRRLDFATTQAKVISKYTLDAAVALENARDIMETKRRRCVVVLNFAELCECLHSWRRVAEWCPSPGGTNLLPEYSGPQLPFT